MTEATSILLTIMFTATGTAIGFIFGWFGNTYFITYMQSEIEQNIHPEMMDDEGFIVNEELLAVRFVDEDDWGEDIDED
jgi:hexokinase